MHPQAAAGNKQAAGFAAAAVCTDSTPNAGSFVMLQDRWNSGTDKAEGLAEGFQLFGAAAFHGGWILETNVDPVRFAQPNRAGFPGVIANRDNQVEVLSAENVNGFWLALMENVGFLQHSERPWVNGCRGVGARAESNPPIPAVVIHHSFRHLAAGGIGCAQNQHLFALTQLVLFGDRLRTERFLVCLFADDDFVLKFAGFHLPQKLERPLLIIEPKPGAAPTREQLLAFLEGKIAKWWTPDDVVFVEKIPLGATGKINKLALRETFKDYKLPSAQAAE